MRLSLPLRRFYTTCGQCPPRLVFRLSPSPPPPSCRRFTSRSSCPQRLRPIRLGRAPRIGAVLIAAMAPGAFVQLAENKEDGKTGERTMLEASRQEIKDDILEKTQGTLGLESPALACWTYYIYDTIATGFRFVHLVVIFLPVILTAPTIWLGKRIKDRDGTRTGTLWWYRFLVRAMERAGPAFIKLGQWAASRTDIFPPEMCSTMSSLHSNAPAHSLHETKRTIRKAFHGMSFEDIFEEFNEEPLGVGAIAQVYRAKLKPNLANLADNQRTSGPEEGLGNKFRKNVDVLVKSTPQRVPSSYVAVKVLHPRVERLIRRDLRIMHFFASLINAIPTMHWLSFPDEVAQFGEMMKLQLDLRIEATNLKVFREKFRSRTTAWFPYPYLDYSTREVLVEEFAQGIPLSTFLENGGGVYQHEIANEGLDAFLHMLLIDNFVHADLHPGNIMVRFYQPSELDLSLHKQHSRASEAPTAAEVDVAEAVLARLRPHEKDPQEWEKALNQLSAEGYRPQLIFIDTGLVTELNETNRRNFLDLFRAVAEFDGHRAGELMVERCRQPEEVIDPDIFALRMQHLVLGVKSRTFALGNIKIGDVLGEVLSMVRRHHVRLEGDFVNVVISILLLEGIGRSMDPNLDLFKSALPILRKLGSNATFLKTIRSGDTSMLRVWVGLEARGLLQASIERVENCVRYDLLSPNI
ncbi:Putative Mitochondrion protein [Aspergillus calidoustus]|uniref:Putative Mitochondrion protein n=1 Tax=Aspergillus calidoustus TaxID=454130 RepID=A0A0U5C3W4_ASPCI|nr:Putative Mitochondrion protein [Aspergillus calidoustus]